MIDSLEYIYCVSVKTVQKRITNYGRQKLNNYDEYSRNLSDNVKDLQTSCVFISYSNLRKYAC